MGTSRWAHVTAVGAAAVVGLGLAAPAAVAAPPRKPPTPVITSSPPAYTNQTSATVTFTEASSTATTYCSLDFARAVTCTSPVSYPRLADGAHTFAVYAKDGKWKSGTASRSWTVDRTPPAAPTVSPPTTPTASTSYSISFTDTSTDVQSYLCQLDGAPAVACASPASGSGLAEGYHTLTVQAVDRAGNVSSAGRAVWRVDTSTPTPVVVSGPATYTSATTATFTFASSESGVTFGCAREPNLSSYTACTSPKTYTGLGNGSHSFRVRATDALGNSAVSATYPWTVAAMAPSLAWSNPGALPAAVTALTGASFGFTTSGTTTLACLLDGVTQASCTSPAAVSGLADGAHTFALLADSGLSTESTLLHRWVVDTTLPSAPAISGPTGTVGSADAQIVVTAGAATDTLTCLVDGVTADCTKTIKLTGLADGVHTVDATATDAAGNTASSQVSWTVDTTAPMATVTAANDVGQPVLVTFDEDVTGVDAGSVALTDEAGAPVASTQACRAAGGAATGCGGSVVRQVRLTPAVRLVPGEHYAVSVNPNGAQTVADAVGNVAGTATTPFRGPLTVSEASPAAAWTWRTVKATKAQGRSYLTEHRKGAAASWTFSGRAVSWLTVVGPTQGRAIVLVDGRAKAKVNNYARATRYGVARTVKGLSAGTHTVKVVVAGRKGARAGKGTFVSVDAFKVGKRVTATPKVVAGWQRVRSASAAGGGYAVTDLAGQAVTVTFRGTGISWLSARGKGYGKAAVYVDGALVATVDGFARTTSWQVPRAVTGLTDARHTVVVKVLGTKSRRATGTAVVVDGFTVS